MERGSLSVCFIRSCNLQVFLTFSPCNHPMGTGHARGLCDTLIVVLGSKNDSSRGNCRDNILNCRDNILWPEAQAGRKSGPIGPRPCRNQHQRHTVRRRASPAMARPAGGGPDRAVSRIAEELGLQYRALHAAVHGAGPGSHHEAHAPPGRHGRGLRGAAGRSDAPSRLDHRTLNQLTGRQVELGWAHSVSAVTIQRIPRRMNYSLSPSSTRKLLFRETPPSRLAWKT